jgi:hypothetical protein
MAMTARISCESRDGELRRWEGRGVVESFTPPGRDAREVMYEAGGTSLPPSGQARQNARTPQMLAGLAGDPIGHGRPTTWTAGMGGLQGSRVVVAACAIAAEVAGVVSGIRGRR